MVKEAIVLAGGFGTRLSSVVNDVPKPVAPVNGKPFLHYILQQIATTEIEKVVVQTIEATGASGMQDMGKVMGMVSKELAGQADGKTISTIVKKKLA